MGVGRFIHHFGTFLLLAATILLVIVDISAPVVNDIALLKVDLHSNSAGSGVTFGTFGYCILDVDGKDHCTKTQIGYDPAAVMERVDGTDFSKVSHNTPKGLTRVMVLHPVATGLCFIAFLLCLGAGIVGSLAASLMAFLAFIVTLVALICDFVSFGIIKSKVNDDSSNSKAHFGVAMWLILVSAICSLIATLVVFVTCCAGRSKKRRESRKMEHYEQTQPIPRRRHFWQRRNRY